MIEIEKHLGHNIYVARYGYTDGTHHHAIECWDCMEIITDDEERENAA